MNGKHRIAVGGLLAAFTLLGCSEEGAREMVVDPQFAPGTSLGVNLDQCANDPRTDPCAWQNGNLNGNNSVYAEGLVVPFRLAIEGLTPGEHSIHINYDFTAGGHKAYDYLADYDATEIVNLCAPGAGGRSSLCGASNTTMPGAVSSDVQPFGGDGFTVDSKSVDGAIADGGVPTNLTIFGGTITTISGVTHAGSTDGNSTGDIVVTFDVDVGGTAVALAWGGHLAKSSYWNGPGDLDGAGEVSGAPWHMRTQQLDDSGNKNQDRSIQPSALIADPMLAISKTVVTDSITAGDTLRFEIKVWNEGEGDATNVTLEDTLPSGFAWEEDSDDCTIASDILACMFGDLIPGDTVTVIISTPTDPDDCGAVPNVAHADAGNDDPVSAGDTATVICPDLNIRKTAAADTVTAGDTISFTIEVWNDGPGTADSVTLADTLPNSGLSWFEDPENADCAIASGILTCAFGDVLADDTVSVTISAETDAADCGTVTNEAWADATNSDAVNDTADVEVECPDLNIRKTAAADTVFAGDTITFTIEVWNDGPGTADSVTLADTLPNSGLSWFEDPANADCAIASGILTCAFGDLLADDTVSVTVSAETDAADCGTVPNKAWASANNDTTEMAADTAVVVACGTASLEPTQTDCSLFTSGNSVGLSILEAGRKGQDINEVNPGVFFLWAEFVAPDASVNIDVVQDNDSGGDLPNFQVLNGLANIWTADCMKIGSLTINAAGDGVDTNGLVLTPGATYIIDVKFDPATLKGEDYNAIDANGIIYTFTVLIDGVLDSIDSLTLVKK